MDRNPAPANPVSRRVPPAVFMENNKCKDGESWFDDILVHDPSAVRSEPDSWSALKARF